MYDNYGDLAGFANFAGANDTSEVPVVRYQDLHRTHAPASAGLAVYGSHPAPPPEFGADPMADEENLDGYGDVAYGDVAYGQAGVQPLPVPKSLPAYAGAHGYGAPTADEIVTTYPVLALDDTGDKVKELQQLLISKGFLARKKSNGKSSADGTFGEKTETALKSFQGANNLPQSGATSTDTWLALYGLSKPTTKTSRTGGSKSEFDWSSVIGAAAEGFGKGAGFAPSGQDTQAVDKPVDTPDEKAGPDWGKIALWSGVAIGGITLTYFIVRAVRNKE